MLPSDTRVYVLVRKTKKTGKCVVKSCSSCRREMENDAKFFNHENTTFEYSVEEFMPVPKGL